MPKPTTHTDVLVPRPTEDNPTGVVANLKLTSNYDTPVEQIQYESAQVIQNDDTTVITHSVIAQDVPGGLLRVKMRVTAEDGAGLRIAGRPNAGNAEPPVKPDSEYWDPPRFQRLTVEVEGFLGAEALAVTRVDLPNGDSELKLNTASALQATIDVSLS